MNTDKRQDSRLALSAWDAATRIYKNADATKLISRMGQVSYLIASVELARHGMRPPHEVANGGTA